MLLEERRHVGARDDSLHQAAALASELAAELDEEQLALGLGLRPGLLEGGVPLEGAAVVEMGMGRCAHGGEGTAGPAPVRPGDTSFSEPEPRAGGREIQTEAMQRTPTRCARATARSVTAALLAAAPLLGGCLSSALSERFLVPRQEWLAEPADLGLPFEELRVPIDRGGEHVHGWFVPAAEGDGRTVILCHGSRANISFLAPYYGFLQAAGWNVVLFDYRGYGRSDGDVSVHGIFEDAEAVLDAVRGRADVDGGPVALFGLSVGAIVAARTAADHPEVAAVVLECLASPGEAIDRALPWPLDSYARHVSLPGRIEPAPNARRIGAPAFFMCGEFDAELTAHLDAWEACAGPSTCWIQAGADHCPHALMVHDQEYQESLLAFLDAAVEGAVPRVEAAAIDEGSVELRAVDVEGPFPLPVELALVGGEGQTTFVRRWMRSSVERWDVEQGIDVVHVAARRARRVDGAPEEDRWTPRPGPLARAQSHLDVFTALAAEITRATDPVREARLFVAELDRRLAEGPFPPQLEAELVGAYLTAGRALLRTDRSAARRLLTRCVEAEPSVPGLHYWPGWPYRAGFKKQSEVAEARALLAGAGDAAP